MKHIVEALQRMGVKAELTEHEVTGDEVVYFTIDGVKYAISVDDNGYLHIDVYDPETTSSYFRYDLWTKTLSRIYGNHELLPNIVEAL
jgi:hypothetical protein